MESVEQEKALRFDSFSQINKGKKVDAEHITEIETWDSGGGQLLDLLTLKDGRVLVISEDAVVLYENVDAVLNGEAVERQTIYL